MTTGATGQLGLALPVQGELSGTWGDTVNNGITQYTNIALAGTLTLTGDGAVTLANTTGDASASNITSTLTGAGTVTAQFAIVRVTGTLTVAKVVTGPSYSKTYTVVNAATGGIVTFKASGQTGVSVAVGESAFVYFNGTDYVKLAGTAEVTSFQTSLSGLTPNTSTTGAVTLAGTLGVASGGTGLTAGTSGGILGYTATGTLASSVALTANALVLGAGAGATPTPMASLGTTTTVLHGNASGAPTFGAVSLTADVTGVLPTANGGTNLGGATPFTSGGVVYASSSSALATGSTLTFDGATLVNSTNSNSGTYIVNRNISTGTTATSYVISDTTAAFGAYTVFGSRSSGFTTSGMLEPSSGGLFSVGLSNGLNIMTIDAYPVKFGVGNTEGMRLTSSSLYTASGINVGIGTSSPASKLDVSGGGALGLVTVRTTIATGGAAVNLLGSSSTYKNWQISAGNVAVFGALEFTPSTAAGGSTFSTPAMLIDSSSNVGIGTTSPSKKLDVNGDALINGLTVGRGAGNFATNTALGSSVLAAISSGEYNTIAGYQAGDAMTSGGVNVAYGSFALSTCSTGSTNTAVGHSALENGTGNGNTVIGYNSGKAITTGQYNTIVGYYNGITTESNMVVLADGQQSAVFQSSAGYSVALYGASIQAGTGITFPATQNASSNANTLDDYEEGTWTPTITNLTIGNGSTSGRYTKIGRVVTVEVSVVWGSTTSASGAWSVSNLPFTSDATQRSFGSCNILDSGVDNYRGGVQVNESSTSLFFLALDSSSTYTTQTNVTASVPMTWTTDDAVRASVTYTV